VPDLRLSRHLRPQRPPTAQPRCAPRAALSAALSRECVCGVLQIAHRGNEFRSVDEIHEICHSGSEEKNRNFIEICHTRVEIMASKFPMAAIRNSDTPQIVSSDVTTLTTSVRRGAAAVAGAGLHVNGKR
jgi:hypothetical protein